MEQQEALPIPDRVVEDVAVHNVPADNHSNRRPRSALTHLVVLTTVLLPITLLPFCFARRNISQLRRRLNECAVIIARLQRDSKTTVLESALRRDQDSRMRELLTEMRQESSKLSAEVRQNIDRLSTEWEHQKEVQTTTENELRSDLQKILEETRHARIAQFAVQKEIGISLADVAAFMHEQSLSQGNEARGIERLRWLALTLQHPLPDSEETNSSEYKASRGSPSPSESE
ncbi:hypothetical protein PILCRDRAFT_818796 [Piloderma croceum F 1598]|uniref:Uncharacterized protein n=1 Tax=Piloderma croceum (strain F 1598) TaxID=765440 RepID=A0A0C3FW53_PILCF|nr:hypothetical protein PILCRDRAFT_818796 [Piloderma croceum F 1598]